LGVHQPKSVITVLLALLTAAYGSGEVAEAALMQALVRAGRQTLPETPADIVSFARGCLLEILRVDIGPSRALTLVDDFLSRVLKVDAPKPSEPLSSTLRPVARITLRPSASLSAAKPSVLLVDPDRIRRSTLARALIRAQCDVTAVDAVEEVIDALGGTSVDVAIVDLLSPWTPFVVDALAALCPRLLVIGRGTKQDQAAPLFEEVGLRLDVRSRDATAEELIDAIQDVIGGQPAE
jgi:hypothetical protein